MIDLADLKKRYLALYESDPCSNGVIEAIENELGIKLPHDFKEISTFYSGGCLGGISHHEISVKGEAKNVVRETLRIRKAIGLDARFMILAEPAESLIMMNLSEDDAAVIWVDAVEAAKANDMSFSNKPDTWKTYGDFFSYLLFSEESE